MKTGIFGIIVPALMKYLCVTYFAQQELMGNRLSRTKTLGSGDDCCDFHIIGKKVKL